MHHGRNISRGTRATTARLPRMSYPLPQKEVPTMPKNENANVADVMSALDAIGPARDAIVAMFRTRENPTGTLPIQGAGKPYSTIVVLVPHADVECFDIAGGKLPKDATEDERDAHLTAKHRRAGWRAVYTKVAAYLLGYEECGQVTLATRRTVSTATPEQSLAAQTAWITMHYNRGNVPAALAKLAQVNERRIAMGLDVLPDDYGQTA